MSDLSWTGGSSDDSRLPLSGDDQRCVVAWRLSMIPRDSKARGSRVDITKRNEKGETRLQAAVIAGNQEEVQRMISLHASVNVFDNNGWLA